MKILLLSDVFGENNNGTTITARRLIENLEKRGHEVRVCSNYAGDETEKYYVLPKRRFLAFNNYIEKKNGVAFADFDEDTVRKAIGWCDFVHFLVPFKVCRKGVKIAKELHKSFSTAFHCQPENVTAHIGLKNSVLANKILYRRFYKRYYKHTRFVHCPSLFIASMLKKNGYKANDLRIISNGVIDTFHPFESEKPSELKDKICIIFTGRYSKEKCHDVLINAVAKSKYCDKIQLIFAGQGPREAHIRKKGAKLKNPPIMKLFTKEELAKTHNFCDLYVHPSDIEIEAIGCIEAFTTGLVPVIADSKRSATRHFALTEKNLFKPNSVKSLAERIDYWLDNPTEKEALSERYKEYGSRFAIENCVDEMEKMFSDSVKYYEEYYRKIEIYGKDYVYPDNPTEHMMHLKHKKNVKPIDKNYDFEPSKPLYKVFSGFLRLLALLFLPPISWLSTNYKIIGRKNLAAVRKQGAVLVSNHVHNLDAALICACIQPYRKIRYVTLKENMDLPVTGPVIKALGGIPLADTFGGMVKFSETIYDLLENNKLVLFFPEASLWPEYTDIRPFQKGAFLYSSKTGAPIVPIVLTFRTLKNGKKQIYVNICPPRETKGKSPAELQNETEEFFKEFIKDFYQKYRGK